MRLAKGHGLGNDYLIVDAAVLDRPLTPGRTAAICDRQRGLGADGILIGDVAQRPFALRILNPDGSEAEKSGNGLRIFGAWLHHRGLVHTGETFAVRLVKDTVRMTIEAELEDGALDIRVDIGRASFRGEDVGFRPRAGETLDYPLELGDAGSARISTVSLSNPHCVVFVDALDRMDFLARAPLLCAHETFAAGTNVQFARVVDAGTLEAWIWERGAGETLASGSSACAVACAAVRRGFLPPAHARRHGGSHGRRGLGRAAARTGADALRSGTAARLGPHARTHRHRLTRTSRTPGQPPAVRQCVIAQSTMLMPSEYATGENA
jgi:diaminopimelate epimerase